MAGKINIEKVGVLAKLPLTDEEKNVYGKQLGKILGYIDQLEEKAQASDIQPLFNPSLNINITRPDIVGTSLTQEEATSNVKDTEHGAFITKGVFENE